MRIQIYGAGIAGTYLFHLLSKEGFDVSVFDKRKTPDCRCAWGIIYREAKKLYKLIDLNLDDYIFLKPKYVVANGIHLKNKGIRIFDKKRLLEDLWENLEFGEKTSDLVVDATGSARAYLPPIPNDRILPTLQTIEEHDVEENIYIHATRRGYAWAFPLGNGKWHIGAGYVDVKGALELIEKLRESYGFEKTDELCRCSAKIRLVQPSKCRPFIFNNIVGVGEAIGCVSGAGEGNAPALHSAKILFECIKNDELERYEQRILTELGWIEVEQKFIDGIMNGKFLSVVRFLPKIVSVENKRTVDHSVLEIKKIMKL